MTQIRDVDFGDPVVAEGIKRITRNLFQPNVLAGGALTVFDVDQIRLAPVSVIFPDGIVMEEDQPQIITIANTVPAANYTITYEHLDDNISGGVPATLNTLAGILDFPAVPDSVILGWVRYPGGAVPLSVEHIIRVPPGQVPISGMSTKAQGQNYFAPHNQYSFQVAAGGGPITVTDSFDLGPPIRRFTQYENLGGVLGTIELMFPFIVQDKMPGRVFAVANVESTEQIIFQLFHQADSVTPLTLTNNVMFNTGGFVSQEMVVQNLPAFFIQGQSYFVKLLITINPLKKIRLVNVGTSDFRFPL